MAENYNGQAPAAPVESTDRGLFDFGKKKDDVDVHTDQHEEGKHHDTLLEKFHQADDKHHNSSSSSSDEEDSEEKKQRKREKKEKKGLKEKIIEKLPGHGNDLDTTTVPVSKPHGEEAAYSNKSNGETPHLEGDNVEKKGLLEKIKDKFSGEKKAEEHNRDVVTHEVAGEEKKGIVEKIKEKIPGHGDNDAEEEKRVHVLKTVGMDDTEFQ